MRLPIELRFIIYEYALSEEQGVTYHEDERRVGWLCLHQPIETATTASANHPVTLDEQPRKRRKLNDGTSRETSSRTHSMVCIGGLPVANQLQFVSHQIRSEARGLGLRCNDVSIFDSMSHLGRFFNGLSPRQTSWVRKVVVRAEDGWDANSTGGASTSAGDGGWREIVEAYPHMTVHIHSPVVRIGTGSYFLMALVIQHQGRGNTDFLKRLSSDPRMQRILTDLVESTSAEQPRLASCVKLFPCDSTFDEKAFQATCLMTDKLVHILSACPGFDIESLTAIAKEWALNGF